MGLFEQLRRRGHPAVAAGKLSGRPRTSMVGAAAPPIDGVDPAGRPVRVPDGDVDYDLFFLTSSCRPCREWWAAVSGRGLPAVVITPGPETESRRAVSALADEALVVMSSKAWSAYNVTRAPWRVGVSGGIVAAEGTPGPHDETSAREPS